MLDVIEVLHACYQLCILGLPEKMLLKRIKPLGLLNSFVCNNDRRSHLARRKTKKKMGVDGNYCTGLEAGGHRGMFLF